MELTDILRRPEGKTLEFKLDLSSPQGFLRTAAAFANTAGGTIVIGVADRTRDVRGVGSPLDLEERAANLISDSIQPRLLPDIEVTGTGTGMCWSCGCTRARPARISSSGPG